VAVFIQVATDAFGTTRQDAARQGANNALVRRPLRGIQAKPNTYAMFRVLRADGTPVQLFNSSSDTYYGDGQDAIGRSDTYANFLIQRYSESRAEKQQIIETFGEDYVFFFGERPRVIDVSGVLLNSADFNWKSEFWENYDQFLRGTKLVEQNARLYFYFDDVVIEGYIMGASSVGDASNPYMLPFQFQLFVTHYTVISKVGSVYIKPSDTGERSSQLIIEPDRNLPNAKVAAGVSSGGTAGFLAQTAEFANNATVSIQMALEKVRNALHARPMEVPSGIGTMANDIKLYPPLEAQGTYGKPRTDQPIYLMHDEYVAGHEANIPLATQKGFDAEYLRLEGLLAKQGQLPGQAGEALEAAARAQFEAAGIDTSPVDGQALLLGRGAFAAIQYVAPAGIASLPIQSRTRLGRAFDYGGAAFGG
jgi:hypothetical protein